MIFDGQDRNGRSLAEVLNTPPDDGAPGAIAHIREEHPELLDTAGGPLPNSGMSAVPRCVLAAIHIASHTGASHDHLAETASDEAGGVPAGIASTSLVGAEGPTSPAPA